MNKINFLNISSNSMNFGDLILTTCSVWSLGSRYVDLGIRVVVKGRVVVDLNLGKDLNLQKLAEF